MWTIVFAFLPISGVLAIAAYLPAAGSNFEDFLADGRLRNHHAHPFLKKLHLQKVSQLLSELSRTNAGGVSTTSNGGNGGRFRMTLAEAAGRAENDKPTV
jgi:hypothetical protein